MKGVGWEEFRVSSSFVLSRASIRWVALLMLVAGLCGRAVGQGFEPLTDFQPDPVQLGRLVRTLSLMRSAAPDHRPLVRVVFYGQSITIYPWWREVSDRLKAAYPFVRFEIHNLAISGFKADRLAYTCEQDVVPLQPDLIILHAYGDELDVGKLLERLRTQTTADVLVQSDHPLTDGELKEVTSAEQLNGTSPLSWAYRNYVSIPRQADRTGCCVAAVRDYWKAYCRARGKKAGQLLADPVHPNEEGNHVLAAAVLAYLLPLSPPGAVDPWRLDRVQDWTLQRHPTHPLRRLTVEFAGTRLDAVADSEGAAPVRVLVDGVKPSETPTIRFYGRTSPVPGQPWPALTTVDSAVPRLLENWTVSILGISEDNSRIEFRVDGSRTGFDGVGMSLTNFVSNSGRVVIPVWSWLLGYSLSSAGIGLPSDYRIEWNSRWVGVDEWRPKSPRIAGAESATTLVSGLPDGVHRLVLEGADLSAVRALRVFRPRGVASLAEVSREEDLSLPSIARRYQQGGWILELQGADVSSVEVESSTNLVDWLPYPERRPNAAWSLPELKEAVRYFRIRDGALSGDADGDVRKLALPVRSAR